MKVDPELNIKEENIKFDEDLKFSDIKESVKKCIDSIPSRKSFNVIVEQSLRDVENFLKQKETDPDGIKDIINLCRNFAYILKHNCILGGIKL